MYKPDFSPIKYTQHDPIVKCEIPIFISECSRISHASNFIATLNIFSCSHRKEYAPSLKAFVYNSKCAKISIAISVRPIQRHMFIVQYTKFTNSRPGSISCCWNSLCFVYDIFGFIYEIQFVYIESMKREKACTEWTKKWNISKNYVCCIGMGVFACDCLFGGIKYYMTRKHKGKFESIANLWTILHFWPAVTYCTTFLHSILTVTVLLLLLPLFHVKLPGHESNGVLWNAMLSGLFSLL